MVGKGKIVTRYVVQSGDATLKGVVSAVLLLGAEIALASAPGDIVPQGHVLPPATWKERNHPDMPVLPHCDLDGAQAVNKMAELPEIVSSEIARVFASGGISEADGPFNSTDFVDGSVPRRRFLRGYRSADYWIIWFEVGGNAGGPRTIALRRSTHAPASSPAFQARPGTIFAGDLCAASKAILAGVVAANGG
ncbi:hypothetical protein [Sphingobium yanoikuyae]|jgi:hypothetical protein|uniref:Uncharacterized protein n=1 Tax=Sphingobium yanoikuyae TaxID=13690 RepID=A0A430BQ41_SPHYA|nr:hypothetical protein [Sphingobium yanoikuyae]RSU54844.1 hypothetical protein DAH51_19410 [Sphingobium yanoikuyae]